MGAALVGVETEYLAQGHASIKELLLIQQLLNVWFIFEFSLRCVAEGSRVFFGPDWRWNYFDLVLVATSLLDILAASVLIGGMEIGRVARTMRLLRITRTLRIVRLLRFLREFRKMVYAMASSAKTLFWSLVLLLFVMYAFA